MLPVLPLRLPHLLTRLFLAGLLVEVVFTAVVLGVVKVMAPYLEGMLALAFGLPVLVGALLLGTASAFATGFFILPKSLGSRRWYIISFGLVLALESAFVATVAFPLFPVIVSFAASTVVTGLSFMGIGLLMTQPLPKAVKILASLLLIVCGGIIAVTQHSQGPIRAQVSSLKKIGYDLYIPDTSIEDMPAVKYIAPLNNQYDGYNKGVKVAIQPFDGATYADLGDASAYLYESKFDGEHPAPDCSNGYAKDVYGHSRRGNHTCTLVSDVNGIRIYLRETVWPQESVDYEAVDQEYFAVIGKTVIWASYDGGFDRNIETKKLVNQEKDNRHIAEIGRQILEHLKLAPPETYPQLVIKP